MPADPTTDPQAPPALDEGEAGLAEARRLLAGCEPFGETPVFGQAQRAFGIEPLGLLRFAAIARDQLIAALAADFAGIGAPEQTRLLRHESLGYVLEDQRFALRVATGVTQGAAEELYPAACRRLRFLADRLREDLREGTKLFVHVTGRGAAPDSLKRLHAAMRRYGPAMLLAVQPEAEPAQTGRVEWLAPGLMQGFLAPQAQPADWLALCRFAEALRRAAPSEPARGAPRVGLCAIVRNEASYIEEWVTFHRNQGVAAFRIYDNASVDGTPAILRRLGIEPVIWGGTAENFDHQQRAAYREAARMLARELDWLGFIDADEFLFGRDRPLATALASFPADAGAIAVQQRVFGSGGQRKRGPGGVLARFTRCAPRAHPENLWFKTIARPAMVLDFDSVHSVTLREGRYLLADGSPLTRTEPHPGVASRRVEGAIGLHHYILKSYEEFREKQARWADRNLAHRFDAAYFEERDRYANAEECRDLAGEAAPQTAVPPEAAPREASVAPRPAATPRPLAPARRYAAARPLAAVTMVYNESDFLPIWLRHYGAQVGPENCFVIDHGTDDGSTEAIGAASRLRIPRSPLEEEARARFISAFCDSLLTWYGAVIYSDVDELLVADPARWSNLTEYARHTPHEVVTAFGLNVLHWMHHDRDLDPAAPILAQRTRGFYLASMCKPMLVKRPVTWRPGFHTADAALAFDGLFNFHLAFVDLQLAWRRQMKRRATDYNGPREAPHHRVSDAEILVWMENWSKLPTVDDVRLDATCPHYAAALRRVLQTEDDDPARDYRIDLGLWGDQLWRIPERFRAVF